MRLLATIGRIIEAFGIAIGVVFGLLPDPTLIPVENDAHDSEGGRRSIAG